MDNLRRVLTMFFKRVSSKAILRSENMSYYSNIDIDRFLKLSKAYLREYTNDEAKNLYKFLLTEFEEQNERMNFGVKQEGYKRINVFDPIFIFSEKILTEWGNYPTCRYEHLLRWRMASYELDEDLFTTAYLAYKDSFIPYKKRDFSWNPVIPHNNFRLNKILSHGIAENHFHLYGSVPHFSVIWISLMNNADRRDTIETFENYDRNRLSSNMHFSTDDSENTLVMQYEQAVIIRLFLYTILKEIPVVFTNIPVSVDELRNYFDYKKIVNEKDIDIPIINNEYNKDFLSSLIIKEPYVKNIVKKLFSDVKYDSDFFKGYKSNMKFIDFFEKSLVAIGNVKIEKLNGILSESLYKKLLNKKNYQFILKILNDHNLIKVNKSKIQSIINEIKFNIYFETGEMPVDYIYSDSNTNANTNKLNISERWFMYQIFNRIYVQRDKHKELYNLFYAYIVIKENIRSELIQINNAIGFDNFVNYQDRKKDFIRNTELEKLLPKLAVAETIINQNIVTLEARIGPENSAEAWCNTIKELDENISGNDESFMDKYYYVVHFIKNPEKEQKSPNSYRHIKKRYEVKQQAEALADFRSRYGKYAKRIYGIDACNHEIGCRPEVFAQAYRYLRNLPVSNGVPNLRASYHAGEDFTDILDGIRAIDEAIYHCNMKCGDRLGHALALGIDATEWYKSKNNKILLSQQDYLDNIVWLYSKISKYKLSVAQKVMSFLEKEYEMYFYRIYMTNMDLKGFQEFLDYKFSDNTILPLNFRFAIPTYYASMKLRGDDPKCYINGFFESHKLFTPWNRYSVNMEYPNNYQLRNNSEVAYLYHSYHYNTKAKEEGEKCIEIKVQESFVEAVSLVQKAMQKTVLQKGIAIETNPSSNYVISNFRRYDKHPIVNFYDYELTGGNNSDCCQIPVSINTDDQGIFATYLENEYALITLALEKAKDKNGNLLYNRTAIYNWIDKIRKMGLEQVFK